MSTQLILYPQNYNGYIVNFTPGSFPEMLADGLTFSTLNAAPYTAGLYLPNPPTGLATASLGSSPNQWRKGTCGGAGGWVVTDEPEEIGGNLILKAPSTFALGWSGVSQPLTGLVPGNWYTIEINIVTPIPMPPAQYFTMRVMFFKYGGGIINSSVLHQEDVPVNVSQTTATYQAQNSNDMFVLGFMHSGLGTSNDIEISSISIKPSPPGIGSTTELNDGQVICDLYEEEDIPLTLSIDDFKNVAEQVKSYSKDFNLPATKRNNQIFNNMFEVTRADDAIIFNPYVKTKCVLKQDGFILFEGYLRMINIKDDEGEISYNVNLYSEVVAFADTLKELTFADLDFEELGHDYTITNIKNSWESLGAGDGLLLTNSLPTSSFAYDAVTGVNNTQVLKYPFVNWTNQMTILADLDKLEVAFRPCIQLKYLIDKIFGNTQFTYTSAFFDNYFFLKLFMDFNWGENEDGATPDAGNYLYQGDDPSSDYFINQTSYNAASKLRFQHTHLGSAANWDNTNYKYISPVNNWNVTCTFEIYLENTENGSRSNSVRIAKFNTLGQHLETFDYNNDSIGYGTNRFKNIFGTFSTILQAGEYIQAQSTVVTAYDIRMGIDTGCSSCCGGACASSLVFTSTNVMSQAWSLLNAQRGELNQWDFLKGIITMFNLVTMVDEADPNNILIEPYSDVFINNTRSNTTGDLTLSSRFDGKVHDWTTKVDVSQMELVTLTELNKMTTFRFVEDDDDYAFNLYKESTSGHLYGSKVMTASTSSAMLPTLFIGEEEIIAEPFAATVSKAVIPGANYSDFVVPVMYTMAEDGTCSAFENSPRIFYNNGTVSPVASNFSVPAQNADPAETVGYFLQFSHMSAIPATSSDRDFVFASEQLFPGVATNTPVNNLFNIYWSPYFNELYNADTRLMTLKVNLTPSDINTFKFYDMVFIKNRTFRVNKIEYKPNELAKVEFILLK
jgi:hypothetical protein